MTNRHPLASAPNTAHNRRLVRTLEAGQALEAQIIEAIRAGDSAEAERLTHLLYRRFEYQVVARG